MSIGNSVENPALSYQCDQQQRIDRLAEIAQELRQQRDELRECLSDAVSRMLGSSPAITELRERSLAAIAKATGAERRES